MRLIEKLKIFIKNEMNAIKEGINAYRKYKYDLRMEKINTREKNDLRSDLLSISIE